MPELSTVVPTLSTLVPTLSTVGIALGSVSGIERIKGLRRAVRAEVDLVRHEKKEGRASGDQPVPCAPPARARGRGVARGAAELGQRGRARGAAGIRDL